ncbi:hypothetical protein FALBO_3279 [Fusarium albosuccineum]|uniref:Uncharacterized protein n=1 Tax=Fusarium albosuccineum TaxID=1237068 RepID=A0A8H4LLW2_9HYPO|nr:hypothetical protein FALBO_3279 [Fusarium albosuccineum]
MSNTTIGTPVPSPPSSPLPDVSGTNFAWAILGIIAAVFFGIVIVDMIRKYRTGELQETGKNLLTIGGLILMLPFLIFTPRNLKRAWIWFTDFFRSEENKRRGKKKDAITLDKQFDSAAIIQRLASKGSAKSKSEPAVNVVENNSESSASTSTAKAKEPTGGVLPDVNTGAAFDTDEITKGTTKDTDRDLELGHPSTSSHHGHHGGHHAWSSGGHSGHHESHSGGYSSGHHDSYSGGHDGGHSGGCDGGGDGGGGGGD